MLSSRDASSTLSIKTLYPASSNFCFKANATAKLAFASVMPFINVIPSEIADDSIEPFSFVPPATLGEKSGCEKVFMPFAPIAP